MQTDTVQMQEMSQVASKIVHISSNKRGFPGQGHQSYQENQASKFFFNDYVSNFYQKLKAGKLNAKVSFATFSRMRPVIYILASFINRRSCINTQHQSTKTEYVKNLLYIWNGN